MCRGTGGGEVLQIGVERAAVAIGDGAGAARHRRRGKPRDAAAQLDHPRGGIGMIDQIEMLRGLRRLVDLGALEGADAGEPVTHIEGVGDLALLAVADAVDAAGDLLLDDLAHRPREPRLERGLVEPLAGLACFEHRQEIGRARQAADMRRQDAVGAELHRALPASFLGKHFTTKGAKDTRRTRRCFDPSRPCVTFVSFVVSSFFPGRVAWPNTASAPSPMKGGCASSRSTGPRS